MPMSSTNPTVEAERVEAHWAADEQLEDSSLLPEVDVMSSMGEAFITQRLEESSPEDGFFHSDDLSSIRDDFGIDGSNAPKPAATLAEELKSGLVESSSPMPNRRDNVVKSASSLNRVSAFKENDPLKKTTNCSHSHKKAVWPFRSSKKAVGTEEPNSEHKPDGQGSNMNIIEDPSTNHNFIGAIDATLYCLSTVNKRMSEYCDYITAQDAEDKPLYQWSKYTRYGNLDRATKELDKAVHELHITTDGIKDARLARPIASIFFQRAAQHSISTSYFAQLVLEVMNRKTETCFGEVDQSSLSEAAKDSAKSSIITEVARLMHHTTASTTCVYSALDLLLKLFYDDANKDIPHRNLENLNLYKQKATGHINHAPKVKVHNPGWHSVARAVASGLLLALLALLALQNTEHLTQLWSKLPDSGVFQQHVGKVTENVGDAVHNATQIPSLMTGQFHAKQNDLFTRIQHIEEACEVHDVRIDNVWEALGPPNERGSYSSGSTNYDANNYLEHRIQEMRQEMLAQVEKLDNELIQLRKHIHRVDIRLTKDVERLQRNV